MTASPLPAPAPARVLTSLTSPVRRVPSPGLDRPGAPVAPVVDLTVHRARLREVAEAPVFHITPELLDALQGSWGSAEELLGR